MGKVGELAYESNFLRTWRIHRVISVVDLFLAPNVKDAWKRRRPQLEQVFVDGDDRRVSRAGGNPELEYLVRWKDFSAEDDEWYPRLALIEPLLSS